MGLKQSIIIVNEYTIKNADGSGSRGATPGKYALRYMARDLATQTIAPVRRTELDQFVMRYMARADAVQELTVADDVPKGLRRSKGQRGAKSQRQRAQWQRDESAPTMRWHTDDTEAHDSEAVAPENVPVPDTAALLEQLELNSQMIRTRLRAMEEESDESLNADALTKSHLKQRFKQAQQLGGVAFTAGDVSMSHEKLHAKANDVQRRFDAGKTVLKTVLSFDHDYLRETGIIADDFQVMQAGDYRGNIDELKLRMAIMAGIDRMARTSYDDLDYIGVIQVDTMHVHAHLVMVDKGVGTVMKDGTQRGKIDPKARAHLRRGLDAYLDEHAYVARYSAGVARERQNVVSFIKTWAMNTMMREASAQYIVSHLPTDETKWRAGSNAEAMRKANTLVREMVESRLSDPESPMAGAMGQITRYANRRASREGLSTAERDELIANGRERVVQQAMNGVYSVLSALPRERREAVRTPLLQVMAMDVDDLLEAVSLGSQSRGIERSSGATDATAQNAADTTAGSAVSLDEFGMRARMYGSRRRFHREQREAYETAVRDWEKAWDDGIAAPASRVMYDHFQIEAEYHGRAAQKYEQILGAVTDDTDWEDDWETVATLGDKCVALRALSKDRSVAAMQDPDAAERYGVEVYGQSGGALLCRTGAQGTLARAEFDSRLAALEHDYALEVDQVNRKWAAKGAHLVLDTGAEDAAQPDTDVAGVSLRRSTVADHTGRTDVVPGVVIDETPDGDVDVHTPGARLRMVPAPEFSPQEVQGVDMHDMRSEIVHEVPVGKKTRTRFATFTAARRRAVDRARAFMMSSGQANRTDTLKSAERDISRAEQTVELLDATDGVLVSEIAQRVERLRRVKQRQQQAQRVTRNQVEQQVEQQQPVLESANEVYDPVREGIGYSFRLDERVRSRVNTQMDAAARDVAAQMQDHTARDDVAEIT